MQALRLPLPPAALRCLRARTVCARVRSRRSAGRPGAWSWSPGSPFRERLMEATGPPRFLGNPMCACPALRPRWDLRARPLAARRCCLPPNLTASAPTISLLSRLHHTACALPVYASRAGLPRPTQHSVPAAGQLCRVGLSTHWVPLKSFRVCFLPSQAFLAHETQRRFRLPSSATSTSLRAALPRRDPHPKTRPRNLLPPRHNQKPRSNPDRGPRQLLCKSLLRLKLLAPRAGLEPVRHRLTAGGFTIELPGRLNVFGGAGPLGRGYELLARP